MVIRFCSCKLVEFKGYVSLHTPLELVLWSNIYDFQSELDWSYVACFVFVMYMIVVYLRIQESKCFSSACSYMLSSFSYKVVVV